MVPCVTVMQPGMPVPPPGMIPMGQPAPPIVIQQPSQPSMQPTTILPPPVSPSYRFRAYSPERVRPPIIIQTTSSRRSRSRSTRSRSRSRSPPPVMVVQPSRRPRSRSRRSHSPTRVIVTGGKPVNAHIPADRDQGHLLSLGRSRGVVDHEAILVRLLR